MRPSGGRTPTGPACREERGAPKPARENLVNKRKLPVDDLRVDTFDAGEVADERGTVQARAASGAGGGCCTSLNTGCNPDITTVFTGNCHNC